MLVPWIGCCVIFAIGVLGVVLGLSYRYWQGHFGADNYLILSGMLLSTGYLGMNLGMFQGRDPSHLTSIPLKMWISEMLYNINIGVVNASLVAFYYRLDAGSNYKILWRIGAGTVSYSILAAIFITPIITSKHSVDGVIIFIMINTTFHVAINVFLTLLPIRPIYMLKMSRKKKIPLYFFALAGALKTTAVIFGVKHRFAVFVGGDFISTWPLVVLDTIAEIHSALIHQSYPAIEQLLRTVFERADAYPQHSQVTQKRAGTNRTEASLNYSEAVVSESTEKLNPEDV